MKGIVLALGLGLVVCTVQTASAQTSATGDAVAPSTTDSPLDQRMAALEKELDDMKMAQAEATGASKQPNNLTAMWDKGLKFETADKSFTLKVGGRLQWDMGMMQQDKANIKKFGNIADGMELRRLRVEMSGDIYNRSAYYAAQVDFAGAAVAVKDAFLGIRNVPVLGNVQVGNFNEEFGLERVTSDKYDLFMEYSLPVQAFTPDRNPGLEFYNSVFQDRLRYAATMVRDTGSTGIVSSDTGYAFAGRLTGLPYYADDGKKLLHLGVGYRHLTPNGDTMTISAVPEWHQSSKKFVSTGAITHVESADEGNFEAALLYGPFCVQSEYYMVNLDRDKGSVAKTGGPADFEGWYVEGSWFVFGGNRTYDKKMGYFARPNITNNFDIKGGTWGALELAGRYSSIGLNDSGAKVAGGKESDTTLGINYYLNPNMRVMLNWVHAMTDKPDNGNADIYMARFQVDF
jgi:phosphate-selective porin OprO/OprP